MRVIFKILLGDWPSTSSIVDHSMASVLQYFFREEWATKFTSKASCYIWTTKKAVCIFFSKNAFLLLI